MYEFLVLALLMLGPKHGYLIASIVNDMIGPYAKLSHGRLYPLLSAMEHQGLLEATSAHTGARGQRVLRVTAAGRRRFHDLALDTEARPGDYQRLFWFKVAFFGLLSAEERRVLEAHYLAYCKAHIAHVGRELSEIEGALSDQGLIPVEEREGIAFAMRHAVAQWRLEIDAVERLGREMGRA
jgi:DNA-binding PadR family transcriptional regulator